MTERRKYGKERDCVKKSSEKYKDECLVKWYSQGRHTAKQKV